MIQIQGKQAVQSVVCLRRTDSNVGAFGFIHPFHARLLLRSLLWSVLFLTLSSPAFAAQVQLAWDAATDTGLSGYKIYYGKASKDYTSNATVGEQTSHTITGLTDGQTYYFAVTAYDTNGKESAYSSELAVYVPEAESMSVDQQSNQATVRGNSVTPPDAEEGEGVEGERVVISPLSPTVTNSLPSEATHSLITNDQSEREDSTLPAEEELYEFEVPKEGMYVVWGLVRAETDKPSFLITVNFNDEAPIMWENSEETRGSAGLWNRVHDRALGGPVIFYLDAGLHTFSIKQEGHGAAIEDVLITNDLDYHPAIDFDS